MMVESLIKTSITVISRGDGGNAALGVVQFYEWLPVGGGGLRPVHEIRMYTTRPQRRVLLGMRCLATVKI